MPRNIDITGQRFGKLVAERFIPGDTENPGRWHCRCDCGGEKEVGYGRLVAGDTSSCGCTLRAVKDAAGERYGRLVVIGLDHQRDRGQAYFKCRCDCGNECVVKGASLRNGTTSSCGCLRLEALRVVTKSHGMSHTRVYSAWRMMKQRCSNPNNQAYRHYGGRGIGYHPDFETFEGFWEVMGESYREGLELERIDNNGDYAPGNLRWATRKEQMQNTRSTVILEIAEGVRRTLAEISDDTGLTPSAIRSRLYRGASIEDAISRPYGARPERDYDYDGVLGTRYGMMVVTAFSRRDANHQKYFHCRCDCGNTKEVRLSSLRYGTTTSCGCVQKRAVSKNTKGKSNALRNFTESEIRRIKNDTHSMSVEDIAIWYNIPEHTVRSLRDGRIYADLDY